VLILRYLQGKTISNIANTLGYTDRQIIRLKKQALDCLVEIKNKQTEKG
jgi:DNA-directed RNA polymerase specialized sigma subunit